MSASTQRKLVVMVLLAVLGLLSGHWGESLIVFSLALLTPGFDEMRASMSTIAEATKR